MSTCALCLSDGVDLRRSHILSRFGYRRLRNDVLQNPAPMVVDGDGHRQTHEQIVERLLCGNCEQLLGNGCENYVARIAYQANGDSDVYRMLDHTSTVSDVAQGKPATVFCCDVLDTAFLVDFAVSIFWRCSISSHPWTQDFSLSAPTNELFRRFLLKEEPSLGNVPIALNVIDQPRGLASNRFDQIICVPGSEQFGTYQVHGFPFNGLYFTMWEGRYTCFGVCCESTPCPKQAPRLLGGRESRGAEEHVETGE